MKIVINQPTKMRELLIELANEVVSSFDPVDFNEETTYDICVFVRKNYPAEVILEAMLEVINEARETLGYIPQQYLDYYDSIAAGWKYFDPKTGKM